jgi:hypothetical protein
MPKTWVTNDTSDRENNLTKVLKEVVWSLSKYL